MKHSLHRYVKGLVGMLAFAAALSLGGNLPGGIAPSGAEAKVTAGTVETVEAAVPLNRNHPKVREAMAVQHRHTPALMSHADVVGTATGLDDAGQPAILVFTRKAVADGMLPDQLDGKRVIRMVTGDIRAMAGTSGTRTRIDPKKWFSRPVPIGVSTGNEGECSAGTIGARVKDSAGRLYALSNNHVYALENGADAGSRILQPGRYDSGCALVDANVIGTLHDFEPINLSGGENVIDAAIAATSGDKLGSATPANGYGTPKTATAPAELSAAVQKYGRTTGLTKGVVSGINATIRVAYSGGVATFVGQIAVRGGGFIKAGDSGSLLVTDPDNTPVGLLFAGGSGIAFANPIEPVLARFGVTIDGDAGAP